MDSKENILHIAKFYFMSAFGTEKNNLVCRLRGHVKYVEKRRDVKYICYLFSQQVVLEENILML